MKWIETKKSTPDTSVDILFYCGEKDGIRKGRFYRHNQKFISNGDKFYKVDVTHWMPLPEPPAKKEIL